MFRTALFPVIVMLASCGNAPLPAQEAPFVSTEVAAFDEPWAMTFLPDGRMLVTEKKGALKIVTSGGAATPITGTPTVDYGGQGGFGDVVAHPDFANNGTIYLSFAEAGEGDTRGGAVARGKLVLDGAGGRIEALQVIWRQEPKVKGRGHYGHRIAFGPDGMLYISSSDRQKFDPAQDMNSNLGKIVRLTDTGMIPSDNPFYDQGRVKAQIWSLGHRNPLGLAFDSAGRLWNTEMGPANGDELNLVLKAANYGYPKVSNGNHYDGRDIPDHKPGDGFEAPKVWWDPTIAPSSLMIYSGSLFKNWTGNALIGGLAAQTLVRVEISGDTAREAERFDMGNRIREVEQGPDGAIYVLEDGEGGRLLKLTPKG